MHPRLPAPGYWLVCVLSVRFRSPTHNQELQLCRKGHCAVYDFIPIPSFTPQYVSQWFSSITLFPSVNRSLSSIFYIFFYSCLFTANFVLDGTASSSPPKSLKIFSTTSFHLFQVRYLDVSPSTAVSPMADIFFSGIFLSKYRHFNFFASLIVFEWETSEFCPMCCGTRRT